MTTVKLHNDLLTIEISTHGAELQSIRNNLTGQEYLWHGNPAFWGRRSPVLFPIVGAVWEGRFRMDGRVYEMGQHGFARDRDFSVIEGSPEDEAWFSLDADEDSLLIYPRRFRLEIGYRLTGERIDVMWRVINRDMQPMSFQIGAHPAFMLPGFSVADDVHGYLMFDGGPDFVRQLIEARGCVGTETAPVILDDHAMLPIAADTFARDAIILAGGRTRRVSLLDKNRCPLLTLLSSAPLTGLWAPRPDAPFVCIEPWWGRADSVGFDGDFADRAYVNTLAAGQTFETSYLIVIDNI